MTGSGETDPQASGRVRLLTALADLVTRRSLVVVGTALVLSAISAWYAATNLQLDANTDSLIKPQREFMRIYRDFVEEFGDLEYLYIAVDSRGDHDAARQAVDEITARLCELQDLPGIYATISPQEQWRLAPRAMETQPLRQLVQARGALSLLSGQASAVGSSATGNEVLAAAKATLDSLMERGAGMSRQEREESAASALLLIGAVTARPGDSLLLAQELPRQYLTSATGRLYFIELLPRKNFDSLETIESTLAQVRTVIGDVARHHRQVDIGLTGKPVLQADELATTSHDMTRGTIAATVLIGLITIVTFRSVVGTILTTAVMGLAFALTYGSATLLVGRLNLLSIVFMLVLVSAGIDYGIHIVARYSELRATHKGLDAVRRAVLLNTVPVWTGALTSAAVFLTAILTDFGGLCELGIVAGAGLVICALLFTTVLPAALALVAAWRERRGMKADGAVPNASDTREPGPTASPTRRSIAWTLAVSAAATLILGGLTPLMRFESNLLRLQADGLPSVEWEHRILEDSVSASWFGAVICSDEAEVQRTTEAALARPEVKTVHSVLDLVKPDSPERDLLRAQLASAIAPKSARVEDATPELDRDLLGAVRSRLGQLISLASIAAPESELVELRSAEGALSRLAGQLGDPATRWDAQETSRQSLNNTVAATCAIGEGARATLRDALPAAVRARFVSEGGKMLVSLFPREDVWELAPLSEFVAAMRKVDPNATGVPITVYESVLDMRSAFTFMSWASLLVIAILVYLDFRSLTATLTCLMALAVAMVWTFGLMVLFGVSLNLANFFGVPMLMGFGIDSCVHLVHRARETRQGAALGWTMRAVMLSAVTTAIGFGTLLFASHKGLQSLGWLIVLGSAACLICSRTLLPAVLCRFPGAMGR